MGTLGLGLGIGTGKESVEPRRLVSYILIPMARKGWNLVQPRPRNQKLKKYELHVSHGF
jgi:hypothetical protein